MQWMQVCTSCDVRWAPSLGPTCWVCNGPGRDLTSRGGAKISNSLWGFVGPATWPIREDHLEVNLRLMEAR